MEYIMDINIYSLTYFLLLLVVWCASILTKNHTCSSIGGAMLIAFFITRGIKEYSSGDTHMYDFTNDLWVVAFIFLFFRTDIIGKLIMGTYGMMILLAYIPQALGFVGLYYETLNSIAALQILVLLGGTIHGHRRNKSIRSETSDGYFEYDIVDYCNVSDDDGSFKRDKCLEKFNGSPYLNNRQSKEKK